MEGDTLEMRGDGPLIVGAWGLQLWEWGRRFGAIDGIGRWTPPPVSLNSLVSTAASEVGLDAFLVPIQQPSPWEPQSK